MYKHIITNYLASGNNKLPKSTLIYSLGTASDCPSKALGLCRICDKCYALQAEKMYPYTVPYRQTQAFLWLSASANDFICAIADKAMRMRTKVRFMRFNESGDFYSQACVDKMEQIAQGLLKHGIKTYTYTARKDLDFSKCEALVVNGSGFMVHNTFKAVKTLPSVGLTCRGDCSKCTLCTKKLGKVISVKIH